MTRALLSIILRHPLSMIGGALATAAALVDLVLIGIDQFHGFSGAYVGILAYLVVPILFVIGLLLIPVGVWRARHRGKAHRLPTLDFNDAGTRARFLAVVTLTGVNLTLISFATYEGVHVLESTEFCGTACHTLMQPQAVSHATSPHASIACVDCHVGPGADSFLQAKLSGAWQVVSASFGLYPTPIVLEHGAVPAAQETCEGCHVAANPVGSVLRTHSTTADDAKNTEELTVLMVHVGGQRGARSEGIHWHADPANQVRYRIDATGDYAVEVEVTDAMGERRLYQREDADEASPPHGWRTMDCIDCHNRVGHAIPPTERALDAAFHDGLLPRTFPSLKERALTMLAEADGSPEEAVSFFREQLAGYDADSAEPIEPIAEALGAVYAAGFFPKMGVDRETYPDHSGHIDSPGCLRCHDDDMERDDGVFLAGDCDLCHTVLAWEEEDPDILKELQP